MRAPLAAVYGNCVFGSGLDDGWAAFIVPTRSYDMLAIDGKRARFLELLAALEAVSADFQIVRVDRSWDVDHYRRELELEPTAHKLALVRYASAQAVRLHELGARRPALFVFVSLCNPERDISTYISRAIESHPREWLHHLRKLFAPGDKRLLRGHELERIQVRASHVQALLSDFLDARPATSFELQWLVRRSFCRGLGEPVIDGFHEPRMLAFEHNGEAVLAPLEGDILRWGSLVPFSWFLSRLGSWLWR